MNKTFCSVGRSKCKLSTLSLKDVWLQIFKSLSPQNNNKKEQKVHSCHKREKIIKPPTNL